MASDDVQVPRVSDEEANGGAHGDSSEKQAYKRLNGWRLVVVEVW